MRSFLAGILRKYEDFLRIDPNDEARTLLRARSFVWFSWTFVFIQQVNITGMQLTYGRWTLDHTIAVCTIVFLLIMIHSLRYTKNFVILSGAVVAFTAGGVLASALPAHWGINTGLLPMMTMLPMLCAMIAGPRMAVIAGVTMLALTAILYTHSMANTALVWNQDEARNLQRALQTGYGTIMATLASAIFSATMFRMFDLLEANVQRAREAEAVKSQFLAAMSHELRTPLNGVLGLTQAMRKTEMTDEQNRLIKLVEASGRSLLTILNDILDMLRLETKKIDIKPEAFDPAGLVRSAVAAWKLPAEEKGLTLQCRLDENALYHLVGDAVRIRQVLANLISNAIKFTDKGAVTVVVKLGRDKKGRAQLLLAVRDTGPGIPKTARENIFGAFQQGAEGYARSHDGAGLGLAICDRLVSLMDGVIFLDSQMGEGTTFYVILPVEPAATVTPQEREEAASDQEILSGLRVLVVEDNPVNLIVAQKLLEALGVDCDSVVNGQECLIKLEKERYDVILMDKHMPVMDGVEATTRIRAMPGPEGNIPIVACTADAGTASKEELLAAGFNDFLAKPVSADDLADAMVRAWRMGNRSAESRAA